MSKSFAISFAVTQGEMLMSERSGRSRRSRFTPKDHGGEPEEGRAGQKRYKAQRGHHDQACPTAATFCITTRFVRCVLVL